MSEKNSFVHLHAHTEYSLLDGAVRLVDDKGNPSELIKYVAAQKMPALAMTDHGNIFGAIEFYSACQKEGVKPIIGMEAYVSPGSRRDKSGTISTSNNHLTLLAKNNQGYENLMKLTSLSYLEGFYYKPRIDFESLEKYHDGIIALSGCLKGKTAETILKKTEQDALQVVGQYEELFGKGNFYLELMDHGIEQQRRVDTALIDLSKKTGIPLVATNDCHYLKKDDAFAHDVLLCIGTGKVLSEPNRMKYATHEFYYKTPKEMIKLFAEVPEAISNTLEIASQCNTEIQFDQILLPHYPVPPGETADTYLEKLCLEGIKKVYDSITDTLKNRLQEELAVIKRMGFSTYFLIVWDFVNFARGHGIPVGPGRGSGAGSLVSYSLGITRVDPIKYGLLFERFLNPDRRSMPDLDIDFSDEGRERVIQYVREKYGNESVAQIITFGSMLARLVIRDVGRVLGIPLSECDKIAKLIPRELGITISSAIKQSPELKTLCESSDAMKQLIEVSQRLEGLKRHTGVHAAGIVIVPTTEQFDINHYIPLARGSKEVTTTQFNDDGLLKLGILKMDFLGLRTLTVLHNAEKMVRERHHPQFDLYNISLEDANTYKLLSDAKTAGVFQLESSGMRDLLRKLKPTNMEDIIALISLYRPGPMGSGLLSEFVTRKHDASKIKYDHPSVEPILKDTYGCMVYQEQVMRISRVVAGFTAGQADLLRKAMGKKIPEEIKKLQKTFLDGAHKLGVNSKIAEKIFEQVEHFGGYGFNKSHATAYGLLSYQTAYLKANYPHEYMAALLTSVIGHASANKEEGNKIVEYIDDAQNMGIEILPPSVQTSEKMFALQGEGSNPKIRFGLLAVKNVGDGAVDQLIAARKQKQFDSFENFCKQVDMRLVNKKVIESLIKAGAFDFCGNIIHKTRAQLIGSLEQVMQASSKLRDDQSVGQGSFFDTESFHAQDSSGNVLTMNIPEFKEWHEHELLSYEKEVLGFYISGHPLAKYKEEFKFYSTHALNQLPQNGNVRIRIAGIIENVRRLISKQQKAPYARFRLEDWEGEIDCVVFPKSYANGLSSHININEMVIVTGRLNKNEQNENTQNELIVDEILTIEKAREILVKQMIIRVVTTGLEESWIEKVKTFITQHPGKCPVRFILHTAAHGDFAIDPQIKVALNSELFQGIKNLLGENSWKLLVAKLSQYQSK